MTSVNQETGTWESAPAGGLGPSAGQRTGRGRGAVDRRTWGVLGLGLPVVLVLFTMAGSGYATMRASSAPWVELVHVDMGDQGHMPVLTACALVVFLAVLAVVGLFARRSSGLAVPVVLWVLGGLALLTPLQVGNDYVYTVFGWVTPIALTFFAAAYLAVRRTEGAGWAFLPLVLVIELVWTLLQNQVLLRLLPLERPSDVMGALMTGLLITGGTALLVPVVALAGRVSRSAEERRAALPAAPQAGWPNGAPGAAYGSPGGGYVAAGATTNTLAVLALVFGLTGISLGAVICGHVGLAQIRRTGERGHGMAVAGLVLGYLALAVTVGVFVFLVVALSSAGAF